MSDRVLIPLPGIGTLSLSCEAFREALKAGQDAIASERASVPARTSDYEPLLNAAELARALSLPKSCVYERARIGAIPSVRVGKHLRFRRSAVLEALGATAPEAIGRS
jgi:excisionase family DNA binding protein